MANLPLRGVANRSLKERWQKWRRRKPHSLSTWTISLAALGVDRRRMRGFLRRPIAGGARGTQAGGARPRRRRPRRRAGAIDDGTASDSLVARTAGTETEFQTQLAAAQARVIGALHQLVEQLRFLDNVEDVPAAKLRELDAGCRAIWEARNQIIAGEPIGSKTKATTKRSTCWIWPCSGLDLPYAIPREVIFRRSKRKR